MRTEKEVCKLIKSFAQAKKEIRLVLLQGSRANAMAKKDSFQDYDIAFFMKSKDIKKFIHDESWLKVFGRVLFIQKPEAMELYPPDLKKGWFSFLVLFADGIRIDFMLIPLKESASVFKHEKLLKVLVDKDDIAPKLKPTDRDFYIKPLSKRSFEDCINEFYFLYTYVHKGLLRKEILYANFYLNALRDTLFIMLDWEAGIKMQGFAKTSYVQGVQKALKRDQRPPLKLRPLQVQGMSGRPHAKRPAMRGDTKIQFAFSSGKQHKLLPYFLSKKTYKKLLKSYALGDKAAGFKALQVLESLFFKSAAYLAKAMAYPLPECRKRVREYCGVLEAALRGGL